MDASKELTLENPAYEKAVDLYVMQAYLLDVGAGDITTEYFLSAPEQQKKVTAEIVVNESGILAGIQEAEWFLHKIGIRISKQLKDGASVKRGQMIMTIEATARKILMAERTLLNLLQRMSGVATATNKLVSKLPKNINLLATRKTLCGPLDKRAVAVGGGGTHRLNLSDAVMIKDNHLSLVPDLMKGLVSVFKQAKKARFIEIELETRKEVEKFLKIYGQLKSGLSGQKIVVMLDNFKPANIRKVVPKLKKAGLYVEVSGGINGKNIRSYAIKGVDNISSGAITGKAPNLNISLNICNK